jgi:hypothetical protein
MNLLPCGDSRLGFVDNSNNNNVNDMVWQRPDRIIRAKPSVTVLHKRAAEGN